MIREFSNQIESELSKPQEELERIREENERLLKENAKLKQELEKSKRETMFDTLTGLETRRHFQSEMEKIISSMLEGEKREKRQEGYGHVGFLFFDVDNFKKINDMYGHEMGDLVLVRVSEVLRSNLRDNDKVCRWGGEEIVAALLGASEEDALKKAELMRQEIENQEFVKYPELKISVSIGVSGYQKDSGTFKELIKKADEAMYKAKKTGKNKVVSASDLEHKK